MNLRRNNKIKIRTDDPSDEAIEVSDDDVGEDVEILPDENHPEKIHQEINYTAIAVLALALLLTVVNLLSWVRK